MSGFALKFQQTKELTPPPPPHPNRNVICDCWREEKKEKENQTVKASIFFRNAWKLQDINFRAFFFSFFILSVLLPFCCHSMWSQLQCDCDRDHVVLSQVSEWVNWCWATVHVQVTRLFFFFFHQSEIPATLTTGEKQCIWKIFI